MPDGDQWTAIAQLREGHTRHERELGSISAEMKAMAHDVSQIAEEARKTRHETRNAVTASELRITERLDRFIATGRWIVMAAVPIIFGLLGLLIGRS